MGHKHNPRANSETKAPHTCAPCSSSQGDVREYSATGARVHEPFEKRRVRRQEIMNGKAVSLSLSLSVSLLFSLARAAASATGPMGRRRREPRGPIAADRAIQRSSSLRRGRRLKYPGLTRERGTSALVALPPRRIVLQWSFRFFTVVIVHCTVGVEDLSLQGNRARD